MSRTPEGHRRLLLAIGAARGKVGGISGGAPMAKTIEAVFEDGVFKPLEPVQLENGQKVQVYVPWAPCGPTREQALESMRQLQATFADWTDEDWAEFRETFRRGES